VAWIVEYREDKKMANNVNNLKWDLLQRYRLIEIIALWEGRLTTNHLCHTFGIGRQQASKYINDYLHNIGPNNLQYDTQLKGYKPTEQFKPVVTTGVADEYLHLLNRNADLQRRFETLGLQVTNTAVLNVPLRKVRPEVLRPIITAAQEQKRVEIEYVSMTSPEQEVRVISPHTLVFTGLRWHVRAYCEKNRDYRDFVLSRLRGVPDIIHESDNGIEDDSAWNTSVTIRIKPDPRLSAPQRKVIMEDYDMARGSLTIKTRGPLVHYAMQLMQIDPQVLQGKPSAQQIIVDNLEDIQQWLFH
jgi:predicted DNA-binding transcriptional regulator YafY